MKAPNLREYRQDHAAVPGRSQRGKALRRHWLVVALIAGVLGLGVYIGTDFYRAELRLQQVRATRAELEAQVAEARRLKARLEGQLAKATDDSHMELMAKTMGFIYPHETVYQTNPNSKR